MRSFILFVVSVIFLYFLLTLLGPSDFPHVALR